MIWKQFIARKSEKIVEIDKRIPKRHLTKSLRERTKRADFDCCIWSLAKGSHFTAFSPTKFPSGRQGRPAEKAQRDNKIYEGAKWHRNNNGLPLVN